MRLEWDYSASVEAYAKRPGYPEEAVDDCLRVTELPAGTRACDVGAGTGNLTLPLVRRGFDVVAVEPNRAMRHRGRERTQPHRNVRWVSAVAESLPVRSGTLGFVGFGSSFNVTDRMRSLDESARVLRPEGWLLCLWNHRCLDDPLQARIEELIHRSVPDYRYGSRREDPTSSIEESGWFDRIEPIEQPFVSVMSVEDFLRAWEAHATLSRQAGKRLSEILAGIAELLDARGTDPIAVPYVTRAWVARRNGRSTRA